MANTPEFPKEQEVETIENPSEFMQGFYRSLYYQEAYQEFFKGKKPAADVTEEEKREAFHQDEKAKSALVDYGQYGKHLGYNPDLYPPQVQRAMQTYIDTVRDLKKLSRTQEEKLGWDLMRSQYHGVVGEQLKQAGIVPSEKLGRAFARLVVISKGLEDYSSARQSDKKRIEWKYGA